VVHYDSAREEIVGVSRSSGQPYYEPVWWAARGAYARRAGVRPQWLPGVVVPLQSYRELPEPLPLAELQFRSQALFRVRDELSRIHPKLPLYFPWIEYKGGLRQRLAAITGLFGFRSMRDPDAVNPVSTSREARRVAAAERTGLPGSSVRQGPAVDLPLEFVQVNPVSGRAGTSEGGEGTFICVVEGVHVEGAVVQGWNQALNALAMTYPGRLPDHLN
jgi:hypothetical protein